MAALYLFLLSLAGAGAASMRCWAETSMQGGDLPGSGSMNLTHAAAWCLNSSKCAGFTFESTGCNHNGQIAVHFKDSWGAARIVADPKWSTLLKTQPPAPTYICEGAQCLPGVGRVEYSDPNCFGLCTATEVRQQTIARVPPMGWRSWNLFEERVSQQLLEQQVDALVRVRHEGVSLWDLGYRTVGLDDGWQKCGPDGYHDPATGEPLVNEKFPDMAAMTAYARTKNVSMGWYGNNCGCHGKDDVDRYEQDAAATVKYGFAGIKIDSCGPLTNISSWRTALDAASKAKGDGSRVLIENCRNYAFTQNLTIDTDCDFALFRSTEDNAPDFLSIMHNLMTNSQRPGQDGDVHGGLPVSHPACWSYPDMLETVGSGTCRQDLKPGTCNHQSPARPVGGLDLNQSRAHFGSWCVVSSPLTLGHDLSNSEQYDQAWPVISNRDAIRVNQVYSGDAGRLVTQSSETIQDLIMYHGAGCECPYPGSLPRWAVFAKRLDGMPGSEAGVIAINFGNVSLPANTISLNLSRVFGTKANGELLNERDVWGEHEALVTPKQTYWTVSELAPHSSYFAIVMRNNSVA